MSGTIRDAIYKDLIIKYRKDKIRDYLYAKEEDITLEKKHVLEAKVDELWKDNLKNPDLLNEICRFVVVEYSDAYDIATLNKLKNDSNKKRDKKAFKIIEIKRINSEMITNYSFGVSLLNPNGTDIKVSDTTGLFKIIFSDGLFMYYAKWISGAGKAKTIEGMYAAEKNVWINFLKMMRTEKKKSEKPKNGIFKIFGSQFGLVYQKLDTLQETPVVHQSTEALLQDIDFYYKNVKLFTRLGMPGVRKTLVVGPPGTGKTSIAIRVSKKFSAEKCIAFSTSINDVAAHLINCAKHKVSTLVILEDAESTLANAQSSLLNFLDGVDQPKNMLGSYIIMTTNHPGRIEPRILQRPGRIDKIIKFGVLTGDYALKCAEIYFEGILFNDKNKASTKIGKKIREDLHACVNDMTGAEIKELANSSASYAASNVKDVDVELIGIVKKKMRDSIKDIAKYIDDETPSTKRNGIGFNNGEEQPKPFDLKTFEEVDSF